MGSIIGKMESLLYTCCMDGHNTQDEKLINRFIQETRNTKVVSKYDQEPTSVPCQMINCFCMFSDYAPLTLDEWIACDERRRAEMNGQ